MAATILPSFGVTVRCTLVTSFQCSQEFMRCDITRVIQPPIVGMKPVLSIVFEGRRGSDVIGHRMIWQRLDRSAECRIVIAVFHPAIADQNEIPLPTGSGRRRGIEPHS